MCLEPSFRKASTLTVLAAACVQIAVYRNSSTRKDSKRSCLIHWRSKFFPFQKGANRIPFRSFRIFLYISLQSGCVNFIVLRTQLERQYRMQAEIRFVLLNNFRRRGCFVCFWCIVFRLQNYIMYVVSNFLFISYHVCSLFERITNCHKRED